MYRFVKCDDYAVSEPILQPADMKDLLSKLLEINGRIAEANCKAIEAMVAGPGKDGGCSGSVP